MSDKPILFKPEMVRALQAGKSQTRRVLKQQPTDPLTGGGVCDPVAFPDRPYMWLNGYDGSPAQPIINPPKILVGDRLYVREAWRTWANYDHLRPSLMRPGKHSIHFEADGFDKAHTGRFRQAMHMPRWASRITLIVTDIKVQRIQDISEEDAKAEGATSRFFEHSECGQEICMLTFNHGQSEWFDTATRSFENLWDSINAERDGGKLSWDSNPWVAAYSFNYIPQNIDAVEGEAGA